MMVRHALAAVLIAVAALGGLASAVAAQSQLSGPTVSLDRYELAPGERVRLTIAGFRSEVVNMAFCGNEGRRGSIDCNVRGTQARETEPGGVPVIAEMPVAVPPVACPCIVRVSSQDNLEVAVVPITLVGHPVAEVVGGSEFNTPLFVDIVANAAPEGMGDELRSSLGGSTTYDVTIQVRNTATFEIERVALAATFTRLRYDDIRSIEIPDPGALEPGETWEQTVQVDVPSLTFGDVEWGATASGQGPSVTAIDTTTTTPVLLIVLGVVLLVDVVLLAVRLLMRMRRRRSTPQADDNPFLDEVAYPTDPNGDTSGTVRIPEPQLVR
jgi:hypothetical protein